MTNEIRKPKPGETPGEYLKNTFEESKAIAEKEIAQKKKQMENDALENKARLEKIKLNLDSSQKADDAENNVSPKYEAIITAPDDNRKLPDDVKSDLLLEEQKEHENEI